MSSGTYSIRNEKSYGSTKKTELSEEHLPSSVSVDSKWTPTNTASNKSTQLQPKRVHQRLWSIFLSAFVASLPALLVGCTLGFPSGALLDLVDLEDRPDFKFDTILSDVFGVSDYPIDPVSSYKFKCKLHVSSVVSSAVSH